MTQTGLKKGLTGIAAVVVAALMVVGGLTMSGQADADVTSGRCEPTERQQRQFPRSSQSPGWGIDRDPDTPGIQCADYLFDMDGPTNRPDPAAPRPVPDPRPEQTVEDAGPPAETPVQVVSTETTESSSETTESSSAPQAPGPRVWWNGVFMDMDEFLCFQENAQNPFADTLESTGCANGG